MYLYKSEAHCNDVNKDQVKLELAFIKHYAPNSLPLTVNSHHVLFVKRLLFLWERGGGVEKYLYSSFTIS